VNEDRHPKNACRLPARQERLFPLSKYTGRSRRCRDPEVSAQKEEGVENEIVYERAVLTVVRHNPDA
jgi:hypothetical protein